MTRYWTFTGLLRHGALRERLIVSLDMCDRRDALKLVDRRVRVVGMFKVGRALFMGGGPDFVREILQRGGEVFLDLKFHDTPDKVLRAAVEAARLGVRMFDIHPHAPRVPGYACIETMAKMRIAVARVCRTEGLRRPHLLAVTMLAGLSADDANAPSGAAADRVANLARMAADASLDGVFTSPHELTRVRDACGRRFIIVTSGAVTSGAPTPALRMRYGCDSNAYAIGAADAIRAGADYLVVGSPIWRASEPIRAVLEITEDIERGLRTSSRGALELLAPRPL
ncbi:MAG TPA: orotidine 5'-phosphate decarboxylase / HUMPS family protein [Candidatus Binataceae bacterium]